MLPAQLPPAVVVKEEISTPLREGIRCEQCYVEKATEHVLAPQLQVLDVPMSLCRGCLNRRMDPPTSEEGKQELALRFRNHCDTYRCSCNNLTEATMCILKQLRIQRELREGLERAGTIAYAEDPAEDTAEPCLLL